jgi:hypothetical protein
MAGNKTGAYYTLSVQGTIDTKGIEAQLKAFQESNKSQVILKINTDKLAQEEEKYLFKLNAIKTKNYLKEEADYKKRMDRQYEYKLKILEKETQAQIKQQALVDKQVREAELYLTKTSTSTNPGVQSARTTAGTIIETGAARTAAVKAGDVDAVKAYDAQLQKLGITYENSKASASAMGAEVEGIGSKMMAAIKQAVIYALTFQSIQLAMSSLREGVQYIKDLNKEMTNIQVLGIAGAQTDTQVKNLAENYNLLARELGVTTLEVAKGSVEWLRQGKTLKETETLLRSTAMLSKLGALDAGASTEYLTAITNAYNISVEDTVGVVDKLVAVDNVAATSAGRQFARTYSNVWRLDLTQVCCVV